MTDPFISRNFYTNMPLRHVRFDDHELLLYDTGRYEGSPLGRKHILGYVLVDPEGTVIFEGEEFCPSPLHAPGSDMSLRCLIGFLTLGEDDVEEEYWERMNYGELQLAWRDKYAEDLSLWGMEPQDDDEEPLPEFEDLMERN